MANIRVTFKTVGEHRYFTGVIRYEGGFAIIKDNNSYEIAIPATEIKQIDITPDYSMGCPGLSVV